MCKIFLRVITNPECSLGTMQYSVLFPVVHYTTAKVQCTGTILHYTVTIVHCTGTVVHCTGTVVHCGCTGVYCILQPNDYDILHFKLLNQIKIDKFYFYL